MPIPSKDILQQQYKEKTDKELAAFYEVSEATIRRWRREHNIPGRPTGPRGSRRGGRVKYTKEILEKAVEDSFSVMEVLRRIGLREAGGNHSHISRRIKLYEINTDHFKRFSNSGKPSPYKKHWTEILILKESGKRPASHQIRRALIESGTKYECNECQINSWKNKEITLHVNHISGNWLDSRKENVEFLCPNCHSQTSTFGRQKEKNGSYKPRKNKTYHCKECDKKITRSATLCKSCTKSKQPTKIKWPNTTTLIEMVNNKNYLQVGKDLGVSDNAVRKRIKNHPLS